MIVMTRTEQPFAAASPAAPASFLRRPRTAVTLAGVLALGLCAPAMAAQAAPLTATHRHAVTKVVAAGTTWTVEQTTTLSKLVVEDGAQVVAPDGKSITLTVDGVETGQKLVTTAGVDTAIQPGTYRGDVVLTIATATSTEWFGTVFPLRQALYVDDGVVADKSATAAVKGGKVTDAAARGIHLLSTGEDFNGVWAAGGDYTIADAVVRMTGNGRYDFAGAGASIVGTGDDTRLVVDHADIRNTGAVRTAVIATDGANVIVKDSTIATHDGTLPSDFTPTLFPGQMRTAPWMLGVTGNVRATNLVGPNTTATYIDSSVYSTGWGVLSTDSTQNGKLTAINTKVKTGSTGYGTYADGQTVLDRFLGTSFDVADYGAISTGGTIEFGDSTRSAVAALDDELDLGLTARELRAIRTQRTTIDSDRFGVMWHGGGQPNIDAGTVSIDGGTQIRTGETTFVDKGLQVVVNVDGSDGASLKTGNGVLFQLMESDDPGPVMVDGALVNKGVYHEPTAAIEKNASFDTTVAHETDAVTNFSDIALRGDFYNGMRDGRNLVVNLDHSSLRGVVSSSTTKHAIDTITDADWKQISEVTNTVSPAVNNGAILALTDGASWTPTGTSYLTSLSIDATSHVAAARGRHLTVTVDGVPTTLRAGHTYTGQITVQVR